MKKIGIFKICLCVMLLCSIAITSPLKALESNISLEGDGSAYNPFLIKSEADLIAFRDYVMASDETNNNMQASAKLVSNIALTSNWTPIGNESIVYSGIFNGQGHTISNLVVNSDEKYVGLFAQNNGHILNLKVSGNITSSGDYIGGIVGANYSKLSDVSFNGNINSLAKEAIVGGICGINSGAISNTLSQGEISAIGVDSVIGGNVGVVESGTMYHVINQATVNLEVADSSDDNDCEGMAGGIAGFNYEGLINVSYNQGVVTGNDLQAYTGGIVGLNNGQINQSGNVASVNGSHYTGGAVGYLFKNQETSNKSQATIENSFNYQTVNNQFVGHNDEANMGEIKSSYNVGESSILDGVTNFTDEDIKSGKLAWQLNTIANETLWYQNLSDGNSLPYLKTENDDTTNHHVYKVDENHFSNECASHQHNYDENGVCTICGEKIITLKGLSLVLDGSLGLNFTYQIDDDYADNLMTFEFKIRDRIETIELNPKENLTMIDGKPYYVVRFDVYSDEMSEKIENITTIKTSNKTYTIKNKEYCGYDYLEKVTTSNNLSNDLEKVDLLSKLASELASYDYYANECFKKGNENYLTTIPYRLQNDLDEVKSAQLVDYKQRTDQDNDSYKLKHYSSNMVLREWVSGYYSAQLKDNNVKPENVYIGYRYSDDEDFTYNETTVSNNRYYGYGPTVASAKFDETYQIAFFEKDDEGNYHQLSSIKYASVYSYLYSTLNKGETANLNGPQKAQLNMIKSVYYYGETSKEYFNLTNTEAINENN